MEETSVSNEELHDCHTCKFSSGIHPGTREHIPCRGFSEIPRHCLAYEHKDDVGTEEMMADLEWAGSQGGRTYDGIHYDDDEERYVRLDQRRDGDGDEYWDGFADEEE